MRFANTGLYGTKRFRAGRGNAADPLGIHEDELGPPGRRRPAQEQPIISSGTAALPCPGISPWPANSAVMRNRLWLLPPMARAVVATQPSVRG